MKKLLMISLAMILLATCVLGEGLNVVLKDPTVIVRDLEIGDIVESEINVRNANDFPITVSVEYEGLEFENNLLELNEGDEGTFFFEIEFSGDKEVYIIPVTFSTEEEGVDPKSWNVMASRTFYEVVEEEPEPEPEHCNLASDCSSNPGLDGCSQLDCNWCCDDTCTLLACGGEDECVTDSQCDNDEYCDDGECEQYECMSDSDCDDDEECDDHYCELDPDYIPPKKSSSSSSGGGSIKVTTTTKPLEPDIETNTTDFKLNETAINEILEKPIETINISNEPSEVTSLPIVYQEPEEPSEGYKVTRTALLLMLGMMSAAVFLAYAIYKSKKRKDEKKNNSDYHSE